MAMINYTNKVPLNTNSGVADINKGNANDWNEIKNAFNNQVAQGWYNIGVTAVLTLTYVSFNSTTKIGVIASNLDLTPYLSVGMKFKFTQNSAVKYGIITAISSTQITLFMGNNFTLNNSGISNPFYSMLETPYGFPQSIYSIIDNLEVPTKEFVNNKIVYVKRVTIANLPNNKSTEYPTGLPTTGITINRLDGLYGGQFPINFIFSREIGLSIGTYWYNPNLIQITTGSDRSNIGGYVDVYYTKN